MMHTLVRRGYGWWRALVVVLALAAVVYAPWPFALALAIAAAVVSPLAPLAAGIIADALYYSHGAASIPWATAIGACIALIAFWVHTVVEARIMRA